MSGFSYVFPAEIDRVATTLIIRFDQERLRFAFLSRVVLSPYKGVRPVGVVPERQIVNRRRGRAMDVRLGIDLFGTLDVTEGRLQREVSRGIPGETAAI